MAKCENCEGSGYMEFIGGVMLGAAIGALAGLLFAPYSGRETRRRLQKEGKKLYRNVEERVGPVVSDAKKAMDQKVGELKNQVEKSMKQVQNKLNVAK